MGKSDKRIPISEERWQELGEMKSAGQTYDDLLAELINTYKKNQLIEDMEDIRARTDDDEYVPLEELMDDG